jgi:hypothetical protein
MRRGFLSGSAVVMPARFAEVDVAWLGGGAGRAAQRAADQRAADNTGRSADDANRGTRVDPIALTLAASCLDPRVKRPGAGSLPLRGRDKVCDNAISSQAG